MEQQYISLGNMYQQVFIFLLFSGLLFGCQKNTEQKENDITEVTLDNVVALKFIEQAKRILDISGGTNQLNLIHNPTSLTAQKIPYMNRDLLFGIGVFDVQKPITLQLPDVGVRYMSVMPINEQGYTHQVYSGEETFKISKKDVESDYIILIVRIYTDVSDPQDIKEVNAYLNQIKISTESAQEYQPKSFPQEAYQAMNTMLKNKLKTLKNTQYCYGSKEHVIPNKFRICAINGFGGLPAYGMYSERRTIKDPNKGYFMHIDQVPMDGFWSITVYDEEGLFDESNPVSNTISSVVAKRNQDGSTTVNIGSCGEKKPTNCIETEKNAAYILRIYKPDSEVTEHIWQIPPLQLRE